MKSSTQLDSAVFQLTPTRTRCDLFIIANGKKEKLASGLLNPFLAHLKTAEDQIAKGGYSILLEPEDSDAIWFTKGTVERFVRFVSTPEILERVYTIESEILQIENAISFQGDSDIGSSTVEDYRAKPVLKVEGSNAVPDANDEKAIVLYTPGTQPQEANGSTVQEANSKVQLLKVLETRKNVLKKEQGMAFARAAAAGFDMDHMAPLVSFAKCFGASRLMGACLRFMDLWKGKHDSGQWLEIEAADAMSSKSEFSVMNASGIMLSSVANKQNELDGELTSENNDKAGADTSSAPRSPMNHQIPVGQQEYFPGQFIHPMFPPWPMHSPPGTVPFFQGYAMPGMPYYNYSGNGPFHQPPYQSAEDSQLNTGHRTGHKRQSMDSRDGHTESDTSEMGSPRIRSQDDLEMEKESSRRGSRKKAGRSGKTQSGMVVIRNINYITSKKKDSSQSESNSNSESETDKEDVDLLSDAPNTVRKNISRSSKGKGSKVNSNGDLKLHDEDETSNADGGHWQAFQNCLLRDTDEDKRIANDATSAMKKGVLVKRPQNTAGDDPLAFAERDPAESQDRRITGIHKVSGNVSSLPRVPNDEVLISRGEGSFANSRLLSEDMQFRDMNRKITTANDDFMISGQENQSDLKRSSDTLAVNGYEIATNNLDRTSSHDMADESFIVPFRSMSLYQFGTDGRTAINMDSELPAALQNSENATDKIGNQVYYELNELSLMPERESQKRSISYDPALDYDMQFSLENEASHKTKDKEGVTDVGQGSKNAEKDRRSKVISETLDKKKIGGPIRKGKPLKTSPLDEARVRAEKLRTYKADLQKLKKEKDEAEKKRLEALKMERQKRIAARGSSTSAQSPLTSLATRKSLPTKLSPISHRASKFSDSEPGSSSPLQRSKIRTVSLGSTDSKKASNMTKSIDGSHLTGNRLTRSVSSLSDTKKESGGVTPDSKASMARIRRLSEPKTISSHPPPSVTKHRAESSSKLKASDGPESKKMSAIVNLDRSKAATLPELKIKTSKVPLNISEKKTAVKETPLKMNGGKSLVTSEIAKFNVTNDRISHQSDLDDNPVIEKTVVMLEYQKPSIPVAQSSEEKIGIMKEHNNTSEIGDSIEMVPEYAAICAPPSPMDRVEKQPTPNVSQEKPGSYETKYLEKESANASSISTAETPYQAPFARVSSLEDPCTRRSEYGKAPQASSSGSTGLDTVKAHVSDFENLKLDKIPEALEKPCVKEPKGLRRFLKLGRKNHSTAAREQSELDIASVDGSEQDYNRMKTASSSEVHSLKNLISQDETPTAGNTSQKSSRHFSLLKKLIT